MEHLFRSIEAALATTVWVNIYMTMFAPPRKPALQKSLKLISIGILSIITVLGRYFSPSALPLICIASHSILILVFSKIRQQNVIFKSLLTFMISRIVTLIGLVIVNHFTRPFHFIESSLVPTVMQILLCLFMLKLLCPVLKKLNWTHLID